MPNKSNFNAEQQAAILALEEAFAKSKASELPLTVYASGAAVLLPSQAQSKAIDLVGKAAKLATKAKLELRVTEKYPFVVDLVNTSAEPVQLTY